MKLDVRQAAAFLRNPVGCRAVLLHGDDEGLVRERARELTIIVAGSINDPFRVVELERDNWSYIATEMASLAMTGGRRVVRVREATDAASEPVRLALKAPGDALIVLEAAGLGRGKLRTLIESAPDAAAIACYAETGKALHDLIRGVLAEFGVSAEPDAIRWLADVASGDRSVVRGESEKLALFAGAGRRVDVAMARLCAGDTAGASAEDGLVAATRGDGVASDHSVERALAEGLNGVGFMRMMIGHLQRLHLARLRVAGGMSEADAIRSLRPPVFFQAVPGITASLALWPVDALAAALESARQVEIACKLTGSRPDLLVRRFVAGLARQSAARGRATR